MIKLPVHFYSKQTIRLISNFRLFLNYEAKICYNTEISSGLMVIYDGFGVQIKLLGKANVTAIVWQNAFYL